MNDVVRRAKALLSGYQDPAHPKMAGFDWKPLQQVHQELGEMREIPSHVEKFGQFMDETARKAATTGLTPRDLIKAYVITRASIQRQAIGADKVRAAGLALPPNITGKVRPEGAMGEWLHSPPGQRFLDAGERGQIDEEAVQDAQKAMKPFGKETELDALPWVVTHFAPKYKEVSRLVAAGLKKRVTPDEWRALTKDMRGIGPAKSGFVGSLLGRGDQPTLDARQVILQTGLSTKDASSPLRRAGDAAVDRLASRQSALNLAMPSDLEPFRQHLTHHAIWDRAGNEVTTHDDVVNALRHAATGGRIGYKDGGAAEDPSVLAHPLAKAIQEAAETHGSWDDVPTIHPHDLIGKTIFPIMADLTKTGAPYTGIDSDKIAHPVPMRGGPGYPLIPANQRHGVVWAVQGKGRGTMKMNKDADYGVVMSMNPDTHRSNATFTKALVRTALAHAHSGRIAPDAVKQLDEMIRTPTADPEHAPLKQFPGLMHPDAEAFTDNLTFGGRKRIADVLASPAGQNLGAPNMDKVVRATSDPDFHGVDRSMALYLIKLDRNKDNVVHLKDEGLPEHESYEYGLRGHVVGKFHHPVAAETLWKDWHDEQRAAGKTNLRRAFDLAMPVATVTKEVADLLPRKGNQKYPIQSPKAARLALHTVTDGWNTSDEAVKDGGVSPTQFSNAIKNSDASSTLSSYSPDELKTMIKQKHFKAFKMKDGEVYFGLKHGTNYDDDYGFKHPDLGPNETSLTSVINNEPGAKGIGGPAVVLKAIEHGVTALDAYAVPSKKHPDGFLPSFYRKFGFEELGRVPFKPEYVTKQQFADMKDHWRSQGWDESMGLPPVAIMKWRGKDADRKHATRRYIETGDVFDRGSPSKSDVAAAARAAEPGTGPAGGKVQGPGKGTPGGNPRGVRDDHAARPSNRLTDTLDEVMGMTPEQAKSFGIDPAHIELARKHGYATGGAVEPTEAQKAAGNYLKHHTSFQGIPISIENLKGSKRSGIDPNGKEWAVTMPAHYGYVKGTEGADGDHVDVYLGPDPTSTAVFVVDQQDLKTKAFDEHKALLGFATREAALDAYDRGFSDGKGRDRIKAVARLTVPEFKQWLRRHDTTKPVRGQGHIDRALSLVSRYKSP